MKPALISLLAASISFVGSHFVLSHPLRAPLVRRLGDKGFLGLYSLVSLATFVWMVHAFLAMTRRGVPLWDGSSAVLWAISSLLTLVALALFLGSFRGNPIRPGAAVHPGAGSPEPHGAFRVTRHPMMWGFGLWAVAHIVIAPTGRTLVFAGAILVLALVGAALQDRKKRALDGLGWSKWERQTSYWPRLAALPGIGLGLWLAALALWLALTWAHIWLAYVPTGIWRWVG